MGERPSRMLFGDLDPTIAFLVDQEIYAAYIDDLNKKRRKARASRGKKASNNCYVWDILAELIHPE